MHNYLGAAAGQRSQGLARDPWRKLARQPLLSMSTSRPDSYVSRGGEKLSAALDHFDVDVQNCVCADLGSHVGGFVDCLLRRGAARVYSVDTCYGTLAWALRRDDRVVVLERTNAMHVSLPEPVSIVTVDVGWTPQAKVLPNVVCMLDSAAGAGAIETDAASPGRVPLAPKPGSKVVGRKSKVKSRTSLLRPRTLDVGPLARKRCVVSLIKPHYEVAYLERTGAERFGLVDGVLPDEAVDRVMELVLRDIAASGWVVRDKFDSPIRGHGGNREVFVLLLRAGGT